MIQEINNRWFNISITRAITTLEDILSFSKLFIRQALVLFTSNLFTYIFDHSVHAFYDSRVEEYVYVYFTVYNAYPPTIFLKLAVSKKEAENRVFYL